MLELVGPRGTTHACPQPVCRDVWALHLSLLPSPPTPEPYFHATSQHGGRPSDPEAPGTGVNPQSGGDLPAQERGTSAERDVDDARSSSSSSSEEEDEEDPELEKLLRENSATPSSSSSEDEDGAQPRPRLHDKQRNHKTTFRPYDSPAGNIAVLMLACWTLRLPVMYMDFKR